MTTGRFAAALSSAAADGKAGRLLAERPELDFWQAFAYRAFSDLHTCRPGGAEVAPIPWTAANAWAHEHSVADPDERDDLLFLVFELDAAWREIESERLREEARNKRGR